MPLHDMVCEHGGIQAEAALDGLGVVSNFSCPRVLCPVAAPAFSPFCTVSSQRSPLEGGMDQKKFVQEPRDGIRLC